MFRYLVFLVIFMYVFTKILKNLFSINKPFKTSSFNGYPKRYY